MKRQRLSTAARRELYERCRGAAEFPACNICGLPVRPFESWHESHIGIPHALGGTDTGIAHARCNLDHGAQVVTPYVAKVKRQFDRARDIFRTRSPLPGSRAHWSGLRKRMNGTVEKR